MRARAGVADGDHVIVSTASDDIRGRSTACDETEGRCAPSGHDRDSPDVAFAQSTDDGVAGTDTDPQPERYATCVECESHVPMSGIVETRRGQVCRMCGAELRRERRKARKK